MLTDEVLTYLFDGQPHRLAQPMASWVTSSRRFATFATTFRDKIRKKLRVTQDAESLLDLRFELETAYLLLQERTLSLVYEPIQPREARCPDYAVTYTTSLTFMVEVTRLRTDPKHTSVDGIGERLADAICSKIGQLLPQRSNVIVVGMETLPLTADDLRNEMLRIQQRAERNDAAFLHRHRFRDRADFFNHLQRLSEVLVRGINGERTAPITAWVNPQAKHPLPSKVRTVLYRSHLQP